REREGPGPQKQRRSPPRRPPSQARQPKGQAPSVKFAALGAPLDTVPGHAVKLCVIGNFVKISSNPPGRLVNRPPRQPLPPGRLDNTFTRHLGCSPSRVKVLRDGSEDGLGDHFSLTRSSSALRGRLRPSRHSA